MDNFKSLPFTSTYRGTHKKDKTLAQSEICKETFIKMPKKKFYNIKTVQNTI